MTDVTARRTVAVLLITSAVLFAIGVSVEAGEGHHGEETILGVSPESTEAVIAAVLLSIGLAVAVLRWPRRWVFVVVAIIALAFAVADIVEASEKFESEAGIAIIATVVAIGHLAAALLSVWLARGSPAPVGA
jgi:hypothetical protein